jgi:hypothetical protein
MNNAQYPIPPAPIGCPGYVTKSVQDQCDSVLRRVLDGLSYEYAQSEANRAASDELIALRAIIDGTVRYSDEWLVKMGSPHGDRSQAQLRTARALP